MFKGKIAVLCIALAFVSAAMISAGAQPKPNKEKRSGAPDQMMAQCADRREP